MKWSINVNFVYCHSLISFFKVCTAFLAEMFCWYQLHLNMSFNVSGYNIPNWAEQHESGRNSAKIRSLYLLCERQAVFQFISVVINRKCDINFFTAITNLNMKREMFRSTIIKENLAHFVNLTSKLFSHHGLVRTSRTRKLVLVWLFVKKFSLRSQFFDRKMNLISDHASFSFMQNRFSITA